MGRCKSVSVCVSLLSTDHHSCTAVAIYRLSAVMSAHKATAAELSRAIAARRAIEHWVIADVGDIRIILVPYNFFFVRKGAIEELQGRKKKRRM